MNLDLTDDALAEYEWVEDAKTYREFLIPAEVVNARATDVMIVVDDPGWEPAPPSWWTAPS
jgi:hypothetical protein